MGASWSSYNPIKKTLFAFEHSEDQNGIVIFGVEIQQQKDEIDINRQFIAHSFDELSSSIKTTEKASLVITDSNVLHKELKMTGTDLEILSEAYPNLDLDDFYYQILKTADTSCVAVCRKQYVDPIIEQYKKAQVFITNIDLGVLKIAALLPYFKDVEIQTSNSIITHTKDEFSSIKPNTKNTIDNYTIDTIHIPSTHTLAFAVILDAIANQTAISGNIEEKNTALLQTFKASQFFKKTLQYGVGFLLISLLINFFIFSSKYKTWQELQEEEQIYTTQKEAIEKHQSIVINKEAIVSSIIITGFSKSSYYIDQFTRSQPATVVLKSLDYQPVAKTIRNDKPIKLHTNQVQITGDSADKTSFTAWIQRIELLEFVDQVTIINYGLNKKNKAAFEITITLLHDTEK